MPITGSSYMGAANFANAAQFSLTTPNVNAGGHIYLAVGCDKPLTGPPTDSAGNTYVQVGGTAQPWGSANWWGVQGNLRLPNNSTITVPLPPFGGSGPWSTMSGTLAGIGISGLTSGVWEGSSAGSSFGTAVGVTFPNVPANDYVVGIVVVDGPSADGFTQDPAFTSVPGFNNFVTSTFSMYAGFRRNTEASPTTIQWQPTLGVARRWMALLAGVKS
jgi:hypothetical protein